MIRLLPSLVIGIVVILGIICPSLCQYVLNILMATFSISYIFKTIERIGKKEWHNNYITKRERSRVLYIAVCLLSGFIILNIAWFIQSYTHYEHSHGFVAIS